MTVVVTLETWVVKIKAFVRAAIEATRPRWTVGEGAEARHLQIELEATPLPAVAGEASLLIGEHKGLGLSVAYGLLRRHGGDLDIGSTDDKGAVVTLRLPALAIAQA